MNHRVAVPLLAVLAIAVVVGPAEAHAAAAYGAKAKGKRVVVSPRAGQVVRSHHVRLRVRARGLSGVLRARLNGVEVGNDFGRPRRGVRTLRASISHGLRHGRNVLRVRVRRRGKAPRRATVRFRVRTSRPLVGAGRDRRVVVRRKTILRGQVKHRTHRPAGAKLRWRVVHAPRRGRVRATAAGAKRRPATLTSPAGRTARLRPRARGRYTLELASRIGRSATRDRVTVDVVPPSPLVPINTMTADHGDQRGIRVGATTYLLRDADGPASYLQALALKRKTLEVVWNRRYDKVQALRDDLDGLNDSHLVILVQQPDSTRPSGLDFGELNDVVGRIGVPDYIKLPKAKGTVSAIGVPGMDRGDADVNVVADPEIGCRAVSAPTTCRGRMVGYLTPDQYLNYGFVASERHPFSYGGKEVPPCGAGDPPDRCNDNVGYRVEVKDSRTFEPRPGDGRVYSTNGRGLTAAQMAAEANRMADDLNAVSSEDVVIIQAVSTRRGGEDSYRAPVGPVDKATMTKLALAVARVGGTRDAFNRTTFVQGVPDSGGATYLLVGWAGAREGEGEEAAAGASWPGEYGGEWDEVPMLTGVLRPDRQSRFRPGQVTNSDTDTDALSGLMLARPTRAWPLDDDPGAKRALAFLGGQDHRLGPDPRSSYWTQAPNEATTDSIIEHLNEISYPTDAVEPPSLAPLRFTRPEFDAAKKQLIKELRWVGNVRTYLDKLSSPYGPDAALKTWADVQVIADDIYAAANNPNREVAFKWLELTESILDLLGPVTHEVTGAIAAAMEIAAWTYGATNEGAPTAEEVNVEAHKLGAHLVEQAQQTRETFARMGDVIVSDYAKLSVVGDKGGCAPAPDCPKELAFSEADRIAASADVYRGFEKTAYLELLPLEFHPMALTRHWEAGRQVERPVPPSPAGYQCNLAFPWSEYEDLPRASGHLLQEVDMTGRDHGWDTFVLSAASGSDVHGTPPSVKILKRMFEPVSLSGVPTAGGLGISWNHLVTDTQPNYWFGSKDSEYLHCHWWY
jgi:hypothetical protein